MATAEETNRPFYMVFSSRTDENLKQLINRYYESYSSRIDDQLNEFSLMVPDKYQGKPTLRTIIVIDEKIYALLKNDEDDIDSFKIVKLQLKPHFYPKAAENEIADLFIPLPKFIRLTVCQDHILNRMSAIRKYGIWNKNDYTISFPRANRAEDKHNGTAFIYFKDLKQSRLNDIVLTRLFIHNTKWPETNHDVTCFWRRDKKTSEGESDEKTESVYEEPLAEKSEEITIVKVPPTGNPWMDKKGKHQ